MAWFINLFLRPIQTDSSLLQVILSFYCTVLWSQSVSFFFSLNSQSGGRVLIQYTVEVVIRTMQIELLAVQVVARDVYWYEK